MQKTCSLYFCHRKHYGRGLCDRHYQNRLRHGTVLSPHMEEVYSLLEVVDGARAVVSALAADPDAGMETKPIDKGEVSMRTCTYCGKVTAWVRDDGEPPSLHRDECSVILGRNFLGNTTDSSEVLNKVWKTLEEEEVKPEEDKSGG